MLIYVVRDVTTHGEHFSAFISQRWRQIGRRSITRRMTFTVRDCGDAAVVSHHARLTSYVTAYDGRQTLIDV